MGLKDVLKPRPSEEIIEGIKVAFTKRESSLRFDVLSNALFLYRNEIDLDRHLANWKSTTVVQFLVHFKFTKSNKDEFIDYVKSHIKNSDWDEIWYSVLVEMCNAVNRSWVIHQSKIFLKMTQSK